MAVFQGCDSSWGFQLVSNHWPPLVLTSVVMKAMLSPQPGLPRRQMPYTPSLGLWTLAAKSLTCAQVGLSPSCTPALSARSLRYISIELSPQNGASAAPSARVALNLMYVSLEPVRGFGARVALAPTLER